MIIFYFLAIGIANRIEFVGTFYMHIMEVVPLPLFWLSILPTMAIMYIPYYLERAYWQLWRYPKFYQ